LSSLILPGDSAGRKSTETTATTKNFESLSGGQIRE
jgi:hypothetical protein